MIWNLVNKNMLIHNLFESDIGVVPTPKGYSSEKEDQTVLSLKDTRKTRLTLGMLNKLRIMNDVKKLEHAKKMEELSKQYAAPPADGGM